MLLRSPGAWSRRRLIKNSNASTVPSHANLVADEFGLNLIKGVCDFHVAVAMNVAPGFLEAGEE